MFRLLNCLQFITSLLVFIKHVKSSGCPCMVTTSHDDVIENHTLTSHVVRSQTVNDVGQCFHLCIYDDRCKSFNIDSNQKGLVCELNESNKALSPESFQEIQGRTYYEVSSRLPSEVCEEFICSFICLLIYIPSFHSFSFITFIYTFIHSFIHSFMTFIPSFVCSFLPSFIHSFVHSFVRWSFIHSWFIVCCIPTAVVFQRL